MRFLPRRAPLACLAACVVWAPVARAYQVQCPTEAVWVAPTETVLAVPASSVSATSYFLPTTSVPPTVTSNSFAPTTSYLSPTAPAIPTDQTTSYLSPRRVVAGPIDTTTRYSYELAPTSCCTPAALGRPVTEIHASPCETREIPPPETIGPTISSRVQQAPGAPAPISSSATSRQASRIIISEPKEGPRLEAEAGPAPGRGDVTLPPGPETPPSAAGQPRETGFREPLPRSGIVDGKVVSGTTGQAMRGVRIIAAHRLRPRLVSDREAKTDALGRFAIELPAGDWAIKGVRPDGRTFSIKDIAVGGGRITSDATLTLDPVPPGTPTLDLSPTSDTGPLGDHRTSATRVLLLGRADPNVTVILLPSGARTVSSDIGMFQFPDVALGPGQHVMTARVRDAAGHAADATLTITRAGEPSAPDPVLAWVRMTLEAIRGDAVSPPVATRDLAIVSTAIFDAVAAIRGTPGYYVHESASADASPEAAVAAAAHRALVHLYPDRATTFDAALTDSLAAVPDGPGEGQGVALGRSVADAILALREGDGWEDREIDSPGSGPGVWQPTPPRFDLPLLPQWATVRPFVLVSPSQFRPPGPPGLNSRAWAVACNEVKAIGRADGAARTAEQTQIARIWADGPGTYTPPGHWNLIAAQVAQDRHNSLAANARLFAALNLALADAAIACWDAKYAYHFWRPVTAIRAGDTDGNPDTEADPSWAPLLATPGFPEYVSGHSTFSGAAEVVLSSAFGPDVAFSTSSAGLPGVTRSYTSFRAAAEEAALSRLYAGIHFRFSNQDGLTTGRAVARYVVDAFDVTTNVRPPGVAVNTPASGLSPVGSFAGREILEMGRHLQR